MADRGKFVQKTIVKLGHGFDRPGKDWEVDVSWSVDGGKITREKVL